MEWPQDVCWHCHDALEPHGRQHCTNCPPDGDCDVEGCQAPGCRGELPVGYEYELEVAAVVRALASAADESEEAEAKVALRGEADSYEAGLNTGWALGLRFAIDQLRACGIGVKE